MTVHEADDSRDPIDLKLLKNFGMLKEGDRYYLFQRDIAEPKRLLPLPPHEQTMTVRRNWGLSRLHAEEPAQP